MRVLVDEDLPRSLARALRSAGLDVEDVRDVGLRGHADEEIFAHAVREGRAVITGDVNILRFPPGRHRGIVLLRFPTDISVRALNAAVVAALTSLNEDDLAGNVVVLTPDRIRIRRTGTDRGL